MEYMMGCAPGKTPTIVTLEMNRFKSRFLIRRHVRYDKKIKKTLRSITPKLFANVVHISSLIGVDLMNFYMRRRGPRQRIQ